MIINFVILLFKLNKCFPSSSKLVSPLAHMDLTIKHYLSVMIKFILASLKRGNNKVDNNHKITIKRIIRKLCLKKCKILKISREKQKISQQNLNSEKKLKLFKGSFFSFFENGSRMVHWKKGTIDQIISIMPMTFFKVIEHICTKLYFNLILIIFKDQFDP